MLVLRRSGHRVRVVSAAFSGSRLLTVLRTMCGKLTLGTYCSRSGIDGNLSPVPLNLAKHVTREHAHTTRKNSEICVSTWIRTGTLTTVNHDLYGDDSGYASLARIQPRCRTA